MKVNHGTAEEQGKVWNGPSGRAWVENQALLDEVLRPFETLLVEPLSASDLRILDIGCGTGSTTLAAAGRLGTGGRAMGIDISAPMIAAAEERARREGSAASFVCADAQEYVFQPGGADVVMSRFGVMFFDDPGKAFANLRRAGRSGAVLRCVAWRDPAENPFMTAAERAATPLLPDLPARRPDAPGQFGFADADRVATILGESGWSEVEVRPIDVTCALAATDLLRYVSELGPVGRILQEADEATRTRVIDLVRPAFEPFVHGADVRFTAACWMITARA